MTLPPKGTRVRLDVMPDDPCPIEPGTMGTVVGGSDIPGLGVNVWVNWDNGRGLNLIPGIDQFTIISEPKETI